MVQPINYFQGIQDPFAQAVAGMQLGETYAANQRAQQQAQQLALAKQQQLAQQMQQQQQIATARDTFLANPKPTMRDALTFASILPKDQADAIRPYIEGVSKEQQQGVLRFNGQVLSALQTDPPAGIRLLRERALAERTSGDEQEASLYERMADTAEKQGPEIAFKGLTYIISSMPGAKEMFENIDKTLSTSRLEALAPSALKESIAKADAAVADAQKKLDEAKGTPARLAAEQDLRVAQVEKERALTAASVGGEARAVALEPSALIEAKGRAEKAIADADRAVADAKTAQSTAANSLEKAAADAALTRAQAEKAKVVAEFARSDAVLEAQAKAATIKKTEADILINKENARIAALNAAISKETNALKRQELEQRIKDAQATRDAAAREQTATFNSQVADIDNFLNTAERIKQTPIKIVESATGPIASRLPTTNQDVADFESLVETLGSQVFIAQIPKIKGAGALSEKEGDKLQASVQNLGLKQSPARLIENVNEAVRLMEKARKNLADRSGLQTPALDVPARQEVTVTLPNGASYKFATKVEADAFKQRAGIR